MGTRADFYVGKGKQAKWIGSIAWDGYRDGIDAEVLNATTEDEFVSAITAFFDGRDDVTTPDMGWPWPWDDSSVTDCSYWFFEGQVWDEHGDKYTPCSVDLNYDDEDEYEAILAEKEAIEYPHMKTGQCSAPAGSNRSGIMMITR